MTSKHRMILTIDDVATLVALIGYHLNPDDFRDDDTQAIIHRCKAAIQKLEEGRVTVRVIP